MTLKCTNELINLLVRFLFIFIIMVVAVVVEHFLFLARTRTVLFC